MRQFKVSSYMKVQLRRHCNFGDMLLWRHATLETCNFGDMKLWRHSNFDDFATSTGFQLLFDGNFYRVVTSTEVGTFTKVGTFTGVGTSTGLGTSTGVGTSTGQHCKAFTLKDRLEL